MMIDAEIEAFFSKKTKTILISKLLVENIMMLKSNIKSFCAIEETLRSIYQDIFAR